MYNKVFSPTNSRTQNNRENYKGVFPLQYQPQQQAFHYPSNGNIRYTRYHTPVQDVQPQNYYQESPYLPVYSHMLPIEYHQHHHQQQQHYQQQQYQFPLKNDNHQYNVSIDDVVNIEQPKNLPPPPSSSSKKRIINNTGNRNLLVSPARSSYQTPLNTPSVKSTLAIKKPQTVSQQVPASVTTKQENLLKSKPKTVSAPISNTLKIIKSPNLAANKKNEKLHKEVVDGSLLSEVENYGPFVWQTIKAFAFAYPVNPTELEKKAALDFVNSIAVLFPCENCRGHFNKMINSEELKPNVENHFTFTQWAVKLHNTVNRRLGKREWTFEQARKKWRGY